jgi:hypothetical protein
MTERCEKCNAELRIGDYPFCPHGRFSGAAHPDDVPGGFTVENGFSEPRTFYSKKAHLEALDREGNMLMPIYRENDKVLINWAAGIDAKTMENAAVLMTRRSSKPESVPSAPPALVQALKDALYR